MKKTILILAFLMIQIVSCQTIVPLSTIHVPNGAYVQDTNNTFNKYIGTWEGILNNKKYTFVFTKFPQHPVVWSATYSYYEDQLMGNFKVTDLATNTVIYDNTTATSYDNFRIYGTYPSLARGICEFIFTDTDANCQNRLEFTLKNITGQPNQLKYCYFKYNDWWSFNDCPNYSSRSQIPVYLPMQDLILTKL